MKAGKPGAPDYAAIVSEQMRQFFIRKRKAAANKRSSDTYTPNEYAEETTEEQIESVISEMETHAERAAETTLRPFSSSEKNDTYPDAPQPITKQTPGQKAAIHAYAKREQEQQETKRELSRKTRSYAPHETASADHFHPAKRDHVGKRNDPVQPSGLFSATEIDSSYSPSHEHVNLEYRSSATAFRTASFFNDYSLPLQSKTIDTAQEAGRREFIFTQHQKRSARQIKEKAKKLKRDLLVIARNKDSLLKALAAEGGIALVLAVFILLIGAVGGSGFGIFFSAGDTGDYTIRSAMQAINHEYVERVNAIKTSHYYDELDLSGSRAGWREVLAVYAVKYALDTTNPVDVATMTPEKQEGLSEIFWDMNELTAEVSTRTDTELIEGVDEDGNPTEEEVTYTVTILHIRVEGKTASAMAEEYSFTPDQQQLLQELLSPEYRELWSLVLYGMSMANGEIVAVALSQVGNAGGEPYWSWYGFPYRVEWCACFVSWCANEVGYIEAGVIPMFSYCPTGAAWFQRHGQWADRSFEPTPGCLIFFDWGGDGEIDHVGIVEKCESGRVYTIEGNAGDICAKCSYRVGSSVIAGYGIPEY